MANAPLVVTNAQNGAEPTGNVFEGVTFFLIQRVPQRSKFIADIEANGGKVVKTESSADYLIADHMRNDAPGGSYSYTLIEAAIRDGRLPNPGDHATGRTIGSVREIGSTTIAAKGTRTTFTAEDDRQLWQWVQREKAAGASVKGNELYKRLEAANPRHTHQAWRDRYIKRLIDKPPAGMQAMDATSAPLRPAPAALDGSSEEPSRAVPDAPKQVPRKRQKVNGPGKARQQPSMEGSEGLRDDIELLRKERDFIEDMAADRVDEAWASFAEAYPQRTVQEWKELYITSVKPPLHARASLASSAAVDQARTQAQLAEAKGMTQSKKRKRVAPPREIDQPPSDASEATPAIGCGKEVVRIDSSPHNIKTSTARRAHDVEVNAGNSPDPRTADKQTHIESEGIPSNRHNDILRDPIVTSDVNEAAEQQLQAEYVEHRNASHESAARQDPNDTNAMPTTEASELDEVESQGYTEPSKRQSRDFFGRPRSDTPSSSIAAAVEEQNRVEARSAAIETAGFALTEANLAAQEEQLREPRLRGVDLPEDDEMQDQSDFLKFLQQVTGAPVTQPEPVEVVQDEERSHEVDADQIMPSVPTLAAQSCFAHMDDSTDKMPLRRGNEHLSSQEEVADVLDTNLNWPMSPEQRRKGNEQQSLPFDTQVHRSTTSPPAHMMEASQFASRSLLSQINGVSSPADDGANLDQSPQQRGRLSPFPSSSQINYPEDVYGDENLEGTDAGSEADEIDLTLAEPEGGFDLTPSPEPEQRLHMPLEARSLGHDSQGPTHSTNPSNVVVISSASPPSSSLESSLHSQGKLYDKGMQRMGDAVETQDIYNAETQVPDFAMPPPPFDDGSDENTDSRRLDPEESTANFGRTIPPSAFSSQPEDPHPEEDQSYERTPDNEGEVPSSQDDAAKLEEWMATMQVRGYKEAALVQALKCTSMRVDLAHLVLISTKAGKGMPDDVPGIWSEHEDSVLESGNARGIKHLEAKHGWDECEARLNYLAEWRDA